MKIIKSGIFALIVIITFTPHHAYAWGDWDDRYCVYLTEATNSNVTQNQLYDLFNKIVSMCNTGDVDEYYRINTDNITKNVTPHYSKQDLAKIFKMYCSKYLDVNRQLNGDPRNGRHTIEVIESGLTNCGLPRAYWIIYNDQNKELMGLMLAYENGELKINDH